MTRFGNRAHASSKSTSAPASGPETSPHPSVSLEAFTSYEQDKCEQHSQTVSAHSTTPRHSHRIAKGTMTADATHRSREEINLSPLVVDLDGTLVRSDLLVESIFGHIVANPVRVFGLFWAFARGKAALKSEIALETQIDVGQLPYDNDVLMLIRSARAIGRPVFLASASNEHYVRAIADHLQLFDGWFGSSATENLSSSAKARRLVEAFGEKGFDYVGNSRADLSVWAMSGRCIAVHLHASVKRDLLRLDPSAFVINVPKGRLGAWIKLLRVHQWAKNLLVLVPLLTAQRFDTLSFGRSISATLAFSLAASAIYILNDLADLDTDRKHPSKRRRPLAAGTVPILSALAVVPLLLAAAVLAAFLIAPWFAVVLLAYLVLTTGYTFALKRRMMVDIVTLASLYTIRVIGGATAISVPISEWLLGFAMFFFTALALIKRYVELSMCLDRDLPDPKNRNYRKADISIVGALAAAAGFNAVTIFALYVSSDTVQRLYRHPIALWLVCPILMYWLGRAIVMAQRRLIDDDPIIFALKDWNSLLAFALILTIIIAAI